MVVEAHCRDLDGRQQRYALGGVFYRELNSWQHAVPHPEISGVFG